MVERVDQARIESASSEFANEILDHVGSFPAVSRPGLCSMQIAGMRGFARAHANVQVRARRATRTVVADQHRGSTVLDVSNYWDGVERYVHSVVGWVGTAPVRLPLPKPSRTNGYTRVGAKHARPTRIPLGVSTDFLTASPSDSADRRTIQ